MIGEIRSETLVSERLMGEVQNDLETMRREIKIKRLENAMVDRTRIRYLTPTPRMEWQ
jgi:hypothetical protein